MHELPISTTTASELLESLISYFKCITDNGQTIFMWALCHFVFAQKIWEALSHYLCILMALSCAI